MMKRLTTSPGLTFVALFLAVGLLSIVALSLPAERVTSDDGESVVRVVQGDGTALVDGTTGEATTDGGGGADGGGQAAAAGGSGKRGSTAGPAAKAGSSAAASGAACKAGQNGGNTDIGVTATEIKLASTVVQSGV
ncbi:MAG: hypothetical protein M3394_04555, partial [Actinomycetota bacterium]|nr:hypothetical protein [Actinomycetota bacterium]